MAVLTAALLFTGCGGGGGSKLSPVQKQRCTELQRRWDADIEKFGRVTQEGEDAFKESAALGC